jgi:hypothetical protein
MKNDCLTAALAVLDEAGIRDREIAHGSRHPQLRFRINGGAALHVFSIPGTSGDWRSPANTKSDLRKYLREHGVITAPERPESPPRPAPKPSRFDELERRMVELEEIVHALQAGRAV